MTTKFLWDAGTNGYQATLALTASGDLNALGSGSTKLLTGNSSAGWTQSNTLGAMLGYVWLTTSATAAWTPLTVGGNIAGWFLISPDGGTTFEDTGVAIARAPDFILPLTAAALGTSKVYTSPQIIVPAYAFKTYVQNNTGAAISAQNDHSLTLGLVAEKY